MALTKFCKKIPSTDRYASISRSVQRIVLGPASLSLSQLERRPLGRGESPDVLRFFY